MMIQLDSNKNYPFKADLRLEEYWQAFIHHLPAMTGNIACQNNNENQGSNIRYRQKIF